MHRGCMTTLATRSNGAGSAVCAVAPRPEASERTTMNGATLLIACSSRRAELALERQLAYPLARRREDRVRQCWCRNCGAWLADPAGCLKVPHQMHFDRRALIDPQHANVVEVGLLHPAVLQGHLAPQRAADSEDDPAFDLRFHDVRVHHGATIDRADDPVHAHLTRLRDGNLGDLRSEEHTSELQSQSNLVCRLLLEKKKKLTKSTKKQKTPSKTQLK